MWDQVKNIVGQAAPLVGSLLGGPAGKTVGTLVATALGVQDTPEAIMSELTNNPEALLKVVELQTTHATRLQELALHHAEIESEERKLAISEQNKTIRAELESSDKFVRRWRPTFGYSVCLSWVISFGAIGYGVVTAPKEAANIVNAFVALSPLFGVALTVLGINIHKRSQDKQTEKGINPTPFIHLFGKSTQV